MKPNNVRIDASFYNFANEAQSGELTLVIPSGAVATNATGAAFSNNALDFYLGSELAEYTAMMWNSKTMAWAPVASDYLTAQVEWIYEGTSYGADTWPIAVQIYRVSGNHFRVFASVTGLGGSGTQQFILRENLTIKIRLKTFVQPLLVNS